VVVSRADRPAIGEGYGPIFSRVPFLGTYIVAFSTKLIWHGHLFLDIPKPKKNRRTDRAVRSRLEIPEEPGILGRRDLNGLVGLCANEPR